MSKKIEFRNAISIKIPEDYEFDGIDDSGAIVLRPKQQPIKTWEDWCKAMHGRMVTYNSVEEGCIDRTECEWRAEPEAINIAPTEKVMRAMSAMAKIAFLMPYYGGEVTAEEWKQDTYKHTWAYTNVTHQWLRLDCVKEPTFLAFHTKEQADAFLANNERLVKDFLMIG